ncbi:hypothetical protein BGX38DRAFT_1224011, partial [Terfezia claveryi]
MHHSFLMDPPQRLEYILQTNSKLSRVLKKLQMNTLSCRYKLWDRPGFAWSLKQLEDIDFRADCL